MAGRKTCWEPYKEKRQELPASVGALDPWMHLAAAITAGAFRDLSDKDDQVSLDALYWLAGDEAELFCEALELPHPLAALTDPTPSRRVQVPGGMRFKDWRS